MHQLHKEILSTVGSLQSVIQIGDRSGSYHRTALLADKDQEHTEYTQQLPHGRAALTLPSRARLQRLSLTAELRPDGSSFEKIYTTDELTAKQTWPCNLLVLEAQDLSELPTTRREDKWTPPKTIKLENLGHVRAV